jgi:hypothetical protein
MSERINAIKAELRSIRSEIKKINKKLAPLEAEQTKLCSEWAVLKYGIAPGDTVKSVGCWHSGRIGEVQEVVTTWLGRPTYSVLFDGETKPTSFYGTLKKLEQKPE